LWPTARGPIWPPPVAIPPGRLRSVPGIRRLLHRSLRLDIDDGVRRSVAHRSHSGAAGTFGIEWVSAPSSVATTICRWTRFLAGDEIITTKKAAAAPVEAEEYFDAEPVAEPEAYEEE
jgi:hypothetical protein